MAETCASWCNRNHRPEDADGNCVTVRTMADHDTWVSLTRTVVGDLLRVHSAPAGRELIAVTVGMDLNEDRDMAELLARLGHEDIAAAIRELAALAKEGGAPDA
jgi:hypothetical protein